MKRRTKRWLGGLALAVGALGTAGAVLIKRGKSRKPKIQSRQVAGTWARPGMTVTFRAELMPGRDASERSFRVVDIMPSGRVTLEGKAGEHAETEFERLR